MTIDVVYIKPSIAMQLHDIADELEQFFIGQFGIKKYQSSMYISMGIRVHDWIERFKQSITERVSDISVINVLISEPIDVVITTRQLHELADLIKRRAIMVEKLTNV
ncbi:hypothetical protein vBAbaMPhT2_067 [Acinetobacter phage vB_AbaM_PhT2]|uniref:Uncharacterized protein n=1 Tax=Acinetobacter phage vB_AbaM_PhT2 TaxID=2690230 RepID=A0A6B9SXR4_9CAUD|nr:hypothetical protein HYQ24_gp067 [Acinetobacter phage vB_AbaM_PhT2]QHJ75679.1 hypothetical protein vBAbaMPhT2_067 [Acinetobacter phage vB_AbaM_PhT2]